MAKRAVSQKIGSRGHRWVMAAIEENKDWLVRGLDEDFGVDAEAELTEHGVVGQILKLQIKSANKIRPEQGQVKFDIERKYIDYAKTCRYPVIFVRIDVSNKIAWYLWLQRWILERRARGDRLEGQKSYTTLVAESQTLELGLQSALKDIARWRGETQLALSLIDAMRAAAATYNEELISQITDLLNTAAPSVSDASLDVIIQEAILLGNNLKGTIEGNAISQQLFSLVRKYGDKISTFSVDAIVRRNQAYSRTGLVALGILYDEYFAHISALGLPKHFVKHDLPGVAFYCALREAYPQKRSFDFMVGAGDFTFAGLRFSCPSDTSFENKYANRGPSAILDYLEYAP
jgi:hypothetical protein